jgi:hypothetical protein
MVNNRVLMEGAALLLVGSLVGCSLPAPPSRVLYQQGRMVVQLETDPSAGGTDAAGWNTHPAVIKGTQVATVLRGLRIRSAQGLLGSLPSLSPPSEPVFAEDDLVLLAPILADGLTQAGGAERLGFTLWSPQPGRRHAPISGHVAIRGSYLRFGLTEHPSISWQDLENPPPGSLFELDFQPASYVRPGSDEERKGRHKMRPLIQIDYRGYLASEASKGKPQTAPSR